MDFNIIPNEEQEGTSILLRYSESKSEEVKTLGLVLVPDMTAAIKKIINAGGKVLSLRFVGYEDVITIS